jgi:hypothetical protein
MAFISPNRIVTPNIDLITTTPVIARSTLPDLSKPAASAVRSITVISDPRPADEIPAAIEIRVASGQKNTTCKVKTRGAGWAETGFLARRKAAQRGQGMAAARR